MQLLFAAQATEKNIHLELQVDPALPDHLLCDPARLSQILINLLGNALKFTKAGTVSCDALATSNSRAFRLVVKDTGMGMDQATVAKIFQEFERAESSEALAIEGSGLGLAIVERVVKLMQGTIEVHSELHNGSQFIIELPLEPVAKSRGPGQSVETKFEPGFHVLVVDDNDVNRRIACAHLKRLGIQSSIACDGAQAVAAVLAEHYDLVIMDCQMPTLDGFAATELLRGAPGWSNQVPILALTATVVGDVQTRCLAAGMNALLTKPLARADLAVALRQWLPVAPGLRAIG
jgi:CheY-like chemotaxis protein